MRTPRTRTRGILSVAVAALLLAQVALGGLAPVEVVAGPTDRIVSGAVTTAPGGAPFAGARVFVTYHDQFLGDLVAFDTTTDGSGEYHVYDEYSYGAGDYTVRVSATGYVTQSRTVPWDGSDPLADEDFVLEPAAQVAQVSVVESSTGDPVQGAQVTAYRATSTLPVQWYATETVYTESDGTCEVYDVLGEGSGTYRFSAGASGFVAQESLNYAWDGVTPLDVTVRLVPPLVVAEGTVTEAGTGSAIADVRVESRFYSAGTGTWIPVDELQYSAHDGAYSVSDLYQRGAGMYRLQFYSADHLLETVTLDWDGETPVDVSPVLDPVPPVATGEVTAFGGGAPIEGASIWAEYFDTATSSWKAAGESTSAANGGYVMEDEFRWGAGSYRFHAAATGYKDAGPVVMARVETTETLVVDFALEAVGSAPVAEDDPYEVLEHGTLSVDAPGILGNDSDDDEDALEAVLAEDVSHGDLVLEPDGSFTYVPDSGWWGVDSFTYRASDGYNLSEVATVTITVRERVVDFVALEGSNRYATAIAASQEMFADGSVTTVVIATGENFADALGGSALAGAVGGPLLITKPGALRSDVAAEIERLGAEKAYLLGGPAALSEDVEEALEGQLGDANVERIAGSTRYVTARMVADEVVEILGAGAGYDGSAFVATGENFPDALGASPISAARGMPIILVKNSLAVPGWLDRAVILGGDTVVSHDVEAVLETALGEGNVERIAGSNRYDTAAQVASYGVGLGMDWDGVGIATGEDFPDALAGGPVLGSADAVMLLTKRTSLSPQTRIALESNRGAVGTVRYLGGTSAVSQGVRDAVAATLD